MSMKVGGSGSGQFQWNESRPDGRRAIENHQKAHARGIRNAHKVVDTSTPKFFKIRMNRGREKAGGAGMEPGQFGAGLIGMGAPGWSRKGSSGAALLTRNGSLQDSELFARFAGMATNPRMQSDAGVPIPTSTTKSIVSRSPAASPRSPGAASSTGRASGVGSPMFAAANAVPPAAVERTPPPPLTAADRLTNSLDSQQLQAYDAFVALLQAFPAEDMQTIAAGAVQEARDGQLFSQYGL